MLDVFNMILSLFVSFFNHILEFKILGVSIFEFIVFSGLILLFILFLKLVSSYKKGEAD